MSVQWNLAYSSYEICIRNEYLCKNDFSKKDWSTDHLKFKFPLSKFTEFYLKNLENNNLFEILG